MIAHEGFTQRVTGKCQITDNPEMFSLDQLRNFQAQSRALQLLIKCRQQITPQSKIKAFQILNGQ